MVDIANPYSKDAFVGTEGSFQGRLRYGDLNIDGHPDMLFTLVIQSNQEDGGKEYQNFILFSADCTE